MKDLQSITDLFYKYENKFISNDKGTTDLESILGLIPSPTDYKPFEIVIDLHDVSFLFTDIYKAEDFISFINTYGSSKVKPTLSSYNGIDPVPIIVHFNNSYISIDQDHLEFLGIYISFFEYIDNFVRVGHHYYAPVYYFKTLTDDNDDHGVIFSSSDPNDVYRYAMDNIEDISHLGVDFQDMTIIHNSKLSHDLLAHFVNVYNIPSERLRTYNSPVYNSDAYELRITSEIKKFIDMTIEPCDINVLMILTSLIQSGVIISDTKPIYYVF